MTTSVTEQRSAQATDKTAIRPFRVNIPEAELTELRRRITAARLPDKEPVADFSQGVPLATIEKLATYWATEYDWRKVEARLNAVPNFITEIDGLDIHFIHVRSKHENALPIIITHGWPGSVIEQLKLIEPLANPTAQGGTAADAFHVVIPSMPGYGFSARPTTTGWGPERIARAWDVLMKRLGYSRYVAQGGDWGAIVVDMMGVQAPQGLLGIHTNMAGIFPADIDAAAFSGAPAPSGLSEDEKVAYERLQFVYQKGIAYGFQMGLRPQTLYGIADSPVGLAAYFLDHDARSLELIARVFDGQSEGLTRDDVLDNITIAWLTNTSDETKPMSCASSIATATFPRARMGPVELRRPLARSRGSPSRPLVVESHRQRTARPMAAWAIGDAQVSGAGLKSARSLWSRCTSAQVFFFPLATSR